MKLITAIVRPEMLGDVTRAVAGAGAHGMTVTEVRGVGQQHAHLAVIYPEDRQVPMLPKLRIDLVVQDQAARMVADVIAKTVNTGSIGDGKIWVSPVDSALRVRTGQQDDDAV